MSIDNGIYILTTPKGDGFEYRVSELSAVENYMYDFQFDEETDDPKIHIYNARNMWGQSKVFTNYEDAVVEAEQQYDEFLNTYHFPPEYGIEDIFIDAEF